MTYAASQNLAVNGSHIVSQEYANDVVFGIGGNTTSRIAAYISDMWTLRALGSLVGKAQRLPQGELPGHDYCIRATCTTAETPLAASRFMQITTFTEGSRTKRLRWGTAAAVPISVGFWVRTIKPGTYCLSISNGLLRTRSYIREFEVTTAHTWQWVALTGIPGDTAAGYWDNGQAAVGIRLQFNLCSGSTYATTADTWQAGEFYGTSSQTNLCDAVDNYFDVTGLLILAGSTLPTASDAVLSDRSFEEEITRCMRYTQKTNTECVPPGQGDGRGSVYGLGKNSSGQVVHTVQFPVPLMPSNPPHAELHLVLFDMVGNANRVTTNNGNGVPGYTISAFNEKAFTIQTTAAADFVRFHYLATSRL